MPHSPFTRILAFFIVAGFALALLWPDDRAHVWGWYAMFSLPIVIGLFTWSAVRDAPPFDDNAFHRTLPPGDGTAFRKVLIIHLAILGGIALSVLVYCWIHNFGWQTISYGIAVLTVPVWAWMAANGIAASLSTSREHGLTWGYIAIFGILVLSAAWLYWLRIGFAPDRAPTVYLTPLRTMTLTAIFLYPLIWWLVAAKRRSALGMALGAAIGALMPWLYTYGNFIKAPLDWERSRAPRSHVIITRKVADLRAEKWLPVEDLLAVSGLKQGEFVSMEFFSIDGSPVTLMEVSSAVEGEGLTAVRTAGTAGLSERGAVVWGEAGIRSYLRNQAPDHESFEYWHDHQVHPTRLIILGPGKSAEIPRSLLPPDVKWTEEQFSQRKWKVLDGVTYRFESLGSVDAATGGGFRLPGEGTVRLSPVLEREGRYRISAEYTLPDLSRADGPWFSIHVSDSGFVSPRIIAVDDAGKQAFALDSFRHSGSMEMFLGQSREWRFDLGEANTAEWAARIELLRGCRLHVFWPRITGRLQDEIPAPE